MGNSPMILLIDQQMATGWTLSRANRRLGAGELLLVPQAGGPFAVHLPWEYVVVGFLPSVHVFWAELGM